MCKRRVERRDGRLSVDLKMQFLKLLSSIVKVDTSSSIAKANGNGCSFVHGDDFTSVSLLKMRLLQNHAFARNAAEETIASSPYAKFKETILRGDGKSASVSFLERDCVSVAWRDGTAT